MLHTESVKIWSGFMSNFYRCALWETRQEKRMKSLVKLENESSCM